MKSHKLLFGCGIAVILVLVALAIAGILLAKGIPEVENQIPEGISSNLVNITLPLNGATLPIGKPVSVYVQASGGQPLQDIQLWVDGVQQPVGNSSPAGANKIMSAWTWIPVEEGRHTFVARSNAQNGQAGISNAVHINALSADKIPQPPVLNVTIEPLIIHDDTNLLIQGTDLDEGTTAPPPPGFNEQGGLINAPQPVVEPPVQEPPEGASEQPGSSLIPIKYSLWAQGLKNDIFGGKAPAAPKLWGSASNCDAVLTAQDNSDMEVGFFLYRLDPGHMAFSRILTWGSKAGKAVITYHDPVPASGKYLYYLSAFNSAGESASNIIAVTVDDPQCPAAKNIIGLNSIPIEFSQPVDNAYCYNSTNGSPWERLPYGDNTFIFPVNGKFDLASYWNTIHLPELTPQIETLNLECWGWIGSTLVSLGSQTITYPYGGGGDPGGTIGEPPKYLIAAPYNVEITDDPNVCKDHVPSYLPGLEQDCKDTIDSTYGNHIIVWTYNRFGDCNPATEVCDQDLQPADGFNIYTVIDGKTQSYNDAVGDNISYFPADYKGDYFIRSFNNTVGESADSNHVFNPMQLTEMTLKPMYIDLRRWRVSNYDGSVPHWATTAGVTPDEMLLGYAFICNNNCSNGQYMEGWYNGTAHFYISDITNILSARLNWSTEEYITSGPGDLLTQTNCGVSLEATYNGLSESNTESIVTSMWSGPGAFTVTEQVLLAKMKGLPAIDFSFIAPMDKQPDIRWDRCLWKINNISLTIFYNKDDSTPWYSE